MKFIQLLAIVLLASFTCAEISYNIRTTQVTSKPAGSGGEEFANNLVNAVDSAPQPSGYCDAENPSFPLQNQSLCSGPGRNIGWRFEFNFDDEEAANYQIQFGTDFGWGSAVFANGELVTVRTDDMWWAGNWNSNAVFGLDFDFPAGHNQVVMYGAEGCCDGAMNVRFNRANAGFQQFSVENLENTIPEPTGPSGDCVQLFTECQYQGESLEVCEDNPDTSNIQVRSIYVPEGVTATLYNAINWEGFSAVFSQSVDCMDGPDFQDQSFLELHHITLVQNKSHHAKHLRKQK